MKEIDEHCCSGIVDVGSSISSLKLSDSPEVGAVYTATVTNIQPNGAFATLKDLRPPVSGLISNSQRGNVVPFVGQLVRVKVLQIGKKGGISLSMKEVDQHCCSGIVDVGSSLSSSLKVGSSGIVDVGSSLSSLKLLPEQKSPVVGAVYTATVTNIQSYGVFATLKDLQPASGLIRNSQLRGNIVPSVGQLVRVKVLKIGEKGRISLSMKEMGQHLGSEAASDDEIEEGDSLNFIKFRTLVPSGYKGIDWPDKVDLEQFLPKNPEAYARLQELNAEDGGQKVWRALLRLHWDDIQEALELGDYDDSSFLRILSALASRKDTRKKLYLSEKWAFYIYGSCCNTLADFEEYYGKMQDMRYFWRFFNPNFVPPKVG